MPEVDPVRTARREDKPRGVSHLAEKPVSGLLRDCIVGITCFPDPLPRGGKRKLRWRWRHGKAP
jgi:hypothetical protein